MSMSRKMALKTIPLVEQSLLSASVYINNFKRAVEELVYNSFDAGSSSIAIRVNIEDGFIQILDNGSGISEGNFSLLGLKYATSKYIDISTLKSAPDKYGYRGLSLACIIDITKNVTISSRYENSDDTWMKIFHKGKVQEICKTILRPSKGTTVEIKGFLYNLKIQKQAIDPHNELHNIKTALEQLSLVHSNVSISLRDNATNNITFQIHKNRNVYNTLRALFQINEKDYQEFQVEKNEYKVKAFIGKNDMASTKAYQWIYLNGKYIHKSTLHRQLNEKLSMVLKTRNINRTKNMNGNDDERNYFNNNIPFYFIFLSCPNCDFDMTYSSEKVLVEFKSWKEINKLIEKLVQFYCGDIALISQRKDIQTMVNKEKISTTRTEIKEIMEKILSKHKRPKISQLQNGIKGKILKRIKKKKRDILKENMVDKFTDIVNLSQVKQNEDFLKLEKTKDHPVLKQYKTSKETLIGNKNTLSPPDHVNIKNRENKKNNNESSTKNLKKNVTARKRRKRLARLRENLQNSYFDDIKDKAFYNNKTKTLKPVNIQNIVENSDIIILNKKINNIKNGELSKNYEVVKKSYDLIKTVIPSQYHMTTIFQKHENNYGNQSKRLYGRNTNSYYKETFTPMTYNSHICNIKEGGKRQKISETSCNNFFPPMVNENTSKNTIFLNKNRNLNGQNMSTNNLLKIFHQELQVFSPHTIEMDDTHEIINYKNSTYNASIRQNVIMESRDSYVLQKTCNQTKSLCFGNTYTHENALRSSHNNLLNKTFIVQTFNTQSISSHYFREKENSILRQTIDCASSIASVSKTESRKSEIIYNNIEPLTICEAILDNSNGLQDFENEFLNSFVGNSITNKHMSKNKDYNLKQRSNNSETAIYENTNINSINNDYTCEKISLHIASDLSQNICNKRKKGQGITIFQMKNDIIDHDHVFQLNSRHRFVPKGMSPITKNKHPKTAYCFNYNEVYYNDIIYEKFADDVLANSEMFVPEVHNIKNLFSEDIEKANSEIKKKNANLIFDPRSLRQAKVLGQVDRKFIATVLTNWSHPKLTEFLVLFDQHAVDERIRLETNLNDYLQDSAWKSIELDPISIVLNKDDCLYLFQHKEKLSKFGLQWQFQGDNEILLNTIPKAIFGHHARQVDIVIKAVKKLISEQIDAIKSLRGNISLYPKSIMELVFSEACRYAVKFGDKLSKNDCDNLINSLSYCKAPFQCAHGRPVMAVLMELKNTKSNYKVNLMKTKRFKKITEKSEEHLY